MKGMRFSDQDDFNEEHDRINILVLKNYEKLVDYFMLSFKNENLMMVYVGSQIEGEPRICRIAYPDAVITIHLRVDVNALKISRDLTIKIAVEIKSHIKSFGETLRQLQIYKDCTGSANYHEMRRKLGITMKQNYSKFVYLVTPDHRYDDAFRGQGFDVIDPSFFGESFPIKNQKNLDNF